MRTSEPARGATRPRVRDPEATHEAILAAAQAMMAEHGPSGVTVSDVARRAGVNRGTAYQHFPTRERLIAEVLDRLGRRTKEALDADAPPSLDARVDATVKYFVEHPELIRVSLFRMLAGIPHPSEELWRDYVARVRALATGPGSREGIDADMLAVILLGATMLWSLRVQSGSASAAATRRYLRELKRLLLYGVVRPEHHPELAAAVRGDAVRSGGHRATPARRARRAG